MVGSITCHTGWDWPRVAARSDERSILAKAGNSLKVAPVLFGCGTSWFRSTMTPTGPSVAMSRENTKVIGSPAYWPPRVRARKTTKASSFTEGGL